MRALSLLPVLALVAAQPRTPRWQEIGRTVVGNPVFLDLRTMATKAGITTATLRVAFVKPVRTPRGELTSSRTIVLVDCAKRELAVKENWYFHDERANRVYEHKVVAKPGFSKAFEGSMQGVAMRRLCGAG